MNSGPQSSGDHLPVSQQASSTSAESTQVESMQVDSTKVETHPSATSAVTQVNRSGATLWQQFGFVVILLLGIFYLIGLTRTSNPIQKVKSEQLERYSRKSVAATVEKIDQEFKASWDEAELEPNPYADQNLVMRRLCLALTGMPPSLEQVRWTEELPESERLDHFLAHMLDDPSTHEYLAERIARSWVGTEGGAFVLFRRRRLVDWLAEELGRNRPYDQLAQSVLTSRGLWTDSEPVNFMTGHINPEENVVDKVRITGRVCRCFLGMRLDCLQCHDDFTGTTEVGPPSDPREGLQTDFHSLASFFSQVNTSPIGLHDDLEADVYAVELLGDTEETEIEPAVPYGEQWLPEAEDQLPNRRRFSQWLTHKENRPFARSFVNRMWGLMFGKPLVEPVDDVPLYGPFPPGLEALTDDFIENDYDIRRLITAIVNSDPFLRDSRGTGNLTLEHEELWASFPLTKIRPEQMAGVVHQSASLTRLDDASHVLVQLVRFGEQSDFLQRFGDLGGDEFQKPGETVTQRLLMFNGEMVGERLGSNGLPLNSVVEIARSSPDDETVIRTVYRVVLTREPTQRELEHYLPKVEEDRRGTIEDMFWTLVNSSESLLNH